MKVLWITNILFPEVSRLLWGKGENRGSGGWMLASANAITQETDIKLYVACVSPNVKDLTCVKGEKIMYYVLPLGKGNKRYNSEFEKYWHRIKNDLQPEIIHIHGTEYTHGLAYVKACGSEHVIVSIQGMKSVIADYYTAGLNWKEILSHLTVRDILKGGIYAERREYRRTGEVEKELLRTVNNVIGRTAWDKAHALAINSKINYYFCNESLRSEFMDGSKWKYEKCQKHSIFVSNAIYPLKGFHQLLKAMPIVLSLYPDTIIRVAGDNITSYKGVRALRHETTYWSIIKGLVKKYDLHDKITFTGSLNAEQMKQEYLKTNVFVCPSSIENSPNSIGEAQVLGVPCIGSYVGGIPDMMLHLENNLFRFEDYVLLANKICDIFRAGDSQVNLTDIAMNRHNSKKNVNQLIKIYNEIV